MPAGWSADRLAEAVGAAARRPFDLAAEMPLRARLFRVADDEHVLVAVVHHIAADGWSITPLVADLGVAYASRCAGQAPGWAPLPVQYVDYTLWQRAQLGDLADSDSPIAAQLAYWEQALAGMPEQLVLPTDRPYPPVADYRGARVAVDWPAELQQQIARVAGAHNATSFMVVQAALAVLLAKVSASAEVAVGFPIAGRRDPALDELVGFFVNTLVLRVEVAGDPSVAELLAQVRGRALAAYEHQDVPFEVLVDRLNPTRSLTHHPLVQVMLAWQNLPGPDSDPAAGLALGDLEVTPLPADTHTARMDLVFSLAERWSEAGAPAGIGGTVEFRTDVFDAASIEALIERFRRVVEAITADPTRPLSSIDLLDADEHARLDAIGNRAVLTEPATTPVSVPELVAAQVARTPAAVAISCEGRSLTYRELEEAANRLAHLLAGSGCGPGTVCGAAAGAFRGGGRGDAGGAQDRGGLSGDRPGAARRPDRVHARPMPRRSPRSPAASLRRRGWTGMRWRSSISTTRPSPANPTPRCRRRPPRISPTSSTPRAPPAPRRGWPSATTTWPTWRSRCPPTCRRRRCGRSATPMLSTSRCGRSGLRCWVVGGWWWRPKSVAGSPEDFHALLVAEQVNVLTQTPSAVAALSPQGLESAAVLLGGEACPAEVVERWAPGRVVINAYGPTEATVYASMSAPLTAGTGVVPIGAPVAVGGVVCAGWLVAAGAGGGGRGVVCGRSRGGGGLYGSGRVDRVAVCGVSVRRAGGADVSHRGSGALGR